MITRDDRFVPRAKTVASNQRGLERQRYRDSWPLFCFLERTVRILCLVCVIIRYWVIPLETSANILKSWIPMSTSSQICLRASLLMFLWLLSMVQWPITSTPSVNIIYWGPLIENTSRIHASYQWSIVLSASFICNRPHSPWHTNVPRTEDTYLDYFPHLKTSKFPKHLYRPFSSAIQITSKLHL